ncbi:hypothetical protein [Ktedonobacter racemifer]|nr:hypothetical protein [Ktedonobacter racemifer]
MHMQDVSARSEDAIINVRKLVALDIVFHGPVFIIGEFALAVVGASALGLFSIFFFLSRGAYPIFVGCYLLGMALNYVPLLVYAIAIVRRKSAREEVAFEVEHRGRYVRRYTLQSLLLLVPLLVFFLALYQEARSRRKE